MNKFLASGCAICHTSSTLSAETVVNSLVALNLGFQRTGVSPIAEDIGYGTSDDFGMPLFTPQTAAAGKFKTSGFRNIELTGPYFHNGSQATLEEVIDFYNRHGDIPDGGLGPGMLGFRFSDSDKAALVAFMKALTDDRVRYERAPFDHPEICVPSGTWPGSPILSFRRARLTTGCWSPPSARKATPRRCRPSRNFCPELETTAPVHIR